MAWEPKKDRWDWRKYLTADELRIIERADRSRERIARAKAQHEEKFGRAVQLILNRAIQRAKYNALSSDRMGGE